MASDFEDLFADLGATSLLDVHGEAVTQYPAGNANTPVAAQAIVDLTKENQPPLDSPDGTQRTYFCLLTVPTLAAGGPTLTVSERSQQRDEWLVRSKVWLTDGVESEDAALAVLRLKRTEKVSTKRARV